jgi:hypothetical protein
MGIVAQRKFHSFRFAKKVMFGTLSWAAGGIYSSEITTKFPTVTPGDDELVANHPTWHFQLKNLLYTYPK